MPNISRRIFLRNASIGAAAVGAAAVGGANLLAIPSGAAIAPVASAKSDAPLLDGSGIVAHVVDARSGKIALFVGKREISYVNRDLAQQLLKATR
jgi:hypothetical protein